MPKTASNLPIDGLKLLRITKGLNRTELQWKQLLDQKRRKYEETEVEVTGTVKEIGDYGHDNKILVELKENVSGWFKLEDYKTILLKVNKGDTITFTGKVKSFSEHYDGKEEMDEDSIEIILEKCTLKNVKGK